MQKFVDRFRAKASKAAQAQSRIKQLEKMQDIAVPLEERDGCPLQFDNPVELASPLVVLDEADSLARRQAGLEAWRQMITTIIVIIGPNGQARRHW
ncbi:MAG: hypothetical protein R3C27_00310 [Hyphomonadaceae bacterium]